MRQARGKMLETTIRRPFVFAAFGAMVVVIALELGAPHLIGGGTIEAELIRDGPELTAGEPPGRGISYLALIDILLLYLMAHYALAQLGLGRVQGRINGIVALVGSIVLLIAGVVLLLTAIVEVILMISLFSAAPFGTIAYLGIWGGFPRSAAGIMLSTLLMFQVGGLICLVLAHPTFVRQKGLLIVSGLSLAMKLLLGILHALVPRPLVAITDDIGAIVSAIVGLIVALFFLVFSVPSIIRALRVDRLL